MNRQQRRAAASKVGISGGSSAAASLQFGMANHQAGRLAEAERCYRHVLSLQPNHPDALHLIGCVYLETNRAEQGVASIQRAIALNPGNAEYHSNLATGFARLGKLEDAAEAYGRSLDIDASSPKIINEFGNVLEKLGRMAPALAAYAQGVMADPMQAGLHANLGRLLQHFERLDDALTSFDAAVGIEPENGSFHAHRSSLLYAMKRFDESLASADRAVAVAPQSDEPHNVRGSTLHRMGRHEEAVESFKRALAINPNGAEIILNYATMLVDMQRFDEAEAWMERAIAVRPDYAEAHNNLGLLLLLTGRFERGWRETEWRWKCPSLKLKPVDFEQPLWLGEQPIAGKTVLLHSDQGFGDAVNFVRYATPMADMGARVVVAADGPLVDVLKTVEGVAACFNKETSEPPEFDLHCPMTSLPLAFQTDLSNIPSRGAYIRRHQTGKWRERLGEKREPRIGLVWSGNPNHGNDHNRSLAFAEIAPLTTLPFAFYSLQKDVRHSDLYDLAQCERIIPLGKEIENFADTTALLSELDLLITVDTSIAHLAGALGMKTWLMLPFTPDWRWLLGRDDSPWYPTVRLFRQDETRSWAPVVARIRDALELEYIA